MLCLVDAERNEMDTVRELALSKGLRSVHFAPLQPLSDRRHSSIGSIQATTAIWTGCVRV